MIKKESGVGWILGIILWLVLQNACAQTLPDPSQFPGLVKLRKNVILRPDSQALTRFFVTLDSLVMHQHRKVNILHIGDSHIQADFFSGRVRELFHNQPQFGNGGRGFIFPYGLAKTTDAIDVKMESPGNWKGCRSISETSSCHWGLAGMVASTSDSVADLCLKIPNKGQYAMDKLTLFCPPHVSDEYEWVSNMNQDALKAFGYSKRTGGFSFNLDGLSQECKMVWNRKPSATLPFVLQGCWLENSSPGIVYSSLGVNGAEASSFLRCPDLQKQVRFIQPDLVIISLGTNDAFSRNFAPETFYKNIGELVQRIKMASPDADILFTTPGDNLLGKKYLNRRNDLARQQIMKLAEETGAGVWDFYSIMGGLGSVKNWVKNGLAKNDKVHLTIKGYKLQGDLLYLALTQQYLDYKLSRLSALK